MTNTKPILFVIWNGEITMDDVVKVLELLEASNYA